MWDSPATAKPREFGRRAAYGARSPVEERTSGPPSRDPPPRRKVSESRARETHYGGSPDDPVFSGRFLAWPHASRNSLPSAVRWLLQPPTRASVRYHRGIVLLAVLASALALVVCACGAEGASPPPSTTIPSEPVHVNEGNDETVDEEDGDEGEKGKKDKGKDRGKSQGNGEGDDSD